jgi:hypothetical protein
MRRYLIHNILTLKMFFRLARIWEIIDIVKAKHKDSRTRCFLIGSTLVIVCCVKTVSIDIIPRIFLDPISKAVGYLSQLGTHRRISLALQVFTS